MLISIIIAMYNEEDSIALLLKNLNNLLTVFPEKWAVQFIFVNDGSKDETLIKLKALMPANFNNRILSHDNNTGFGAAMRTGIQNSDGDILVCYDADCTYPVEDIISLVIEVEKGWDVASANPFHANGKMDNVPLWRKFFTWANALLYRIALGKNSSHVALFSCAFRAYKAEVIKSLTFKSNGFGAASEVLGRLIINKARIIEIPSVLSTRQFGISKMNVKKAIGEHFKNLGMFIKIRFFKF